MKVENTKYCWNYCEKLGVLNWISEINGLFELAVI